MLTILIGARVLAYNAKIDGVYYNFYGTQAIVTYQHTSEAYWSNDYTGNIVIPESVNYHGKTYSVTTIGSYAFYGCSGLTSVTIPNSVTTIGGDAFIFCSGLTSVTIGNSVTTIGSDAFYGCSGLTSVTIGNSVTTIGSDAFYGCSGLTSVTIPNSVTSIGNYAFNCCRSLTSVTIGNSVTEIGEWAFYGCSGLTSVTIPNSVTTIGSYAFYGCSGLTTVTIGNSVEYIGDNAFEDCTGLTSVTIPNSVTDIGESAFQNCSNLASVTFENNTKLRNKVFLKCERLTEVFSLSSNPKEIANDAFESNVYAHAILYVPKGTKSDYIILNWGNFVNIEEVDVTAIDMVNKNETDKKGGRIYRDIYYNLQGQRVLNPKNGIYIKNGKKVFIK